MLICEDNIMKIKFKRKFVTLKLKLIFRCVKKNVINHMIIMLICIHCDYFHLDSSKIISHCEKYIDLSL